MRWRLGEHETFARQQPIDLPRLFENDLAVVTSLTPPQNTNKTKLKLLSVHCLEVLLSSYVFLR
jgi:hypothetical protein